MTIVQPMLTPNQIKEITDYVNMYRARHQAPPMSWDSNIAKFSQEWSYHLISTGLFEHSKTRLYGENLAMLTGYGTDVIKLIKKSIDLWYDEISLFDFSNPNFSSQTGHFTCLVWKSSTNFGMGITMDLSNNKVDIGMNTSPPGNVMGKFADNVLPLIQSIPNSPDISMTPISTTPISMSKSDILAALTNIMNDLNKSVPKNRIMFQLKELINKIGGNRMVPP